MMHKLLIGAAIVALAGCSTGNITQAVVNAAYVFDTRGNIESQILSANLSQEGVNTVAAAFTKLKAIRERVNVATLSVDYLEAKKAYIDVKHVITRHYADYSEDQKLLFNDIQLSAQSIDAEIQKSLHEEKLLAYVDTVIKLVTVLK